MFSHWISKHYNKFTLNHKIVYSFKTQKKHVQFTKLFPLQMLPPVSLLIFLLFSSTFSMYYNHWKWKHVITLCKRSTLILPLSKYPIPFFHIKTCPPHEPLFWWMNWFLLIMVYHYFVSRQPNRCFCKCLLLNTSL